MLADDEIEEKVIKIVKDALGIFYDVDEEYDCVDRDTSFDSLNFDPSDMICVISDCESEFDIIIPEDESKNFDTVGNIIEYIENQIR